MHNKTRKIYRGGNCQNAGPDGISGCRDCCGISDKLCIDNCMNSPYKPQSAGGYMGGLMREKIIKIEKSNKSKKVYSKSKKYKNR